MSKHEQKSEIFVKAYLANGHNATKAYLVINPHVTVGTAGVEGHKLLKNPKTQAILHKVLEEQMLKLEIKADRVVRALECIAFFDPIAILNNDGTFKKLSDIPEQARLALNRFQIKILFNGDGSRTCYLKKVKINNKLRALELLGRYLNMFTEKK